MKYFRILTALGAALFLLSSCSKNTPPEQTETSAVVTEAIETEPAREVYTIASDGASNYSIIRSEDMDTDSLKSLITLRKSINEKYGISLTIDSDWSKDNKENNTVTSDKSVCEVLVGNTNRAETRDVAEEYSTVKYGYVIKAVNGKVVIWGSEDATLTYALNYFTENLLVGSSLEIEEGFLKVWDLNGEDMPLSVISSEYTIICSKDAPDKVLNSANLLATRLSELSGVKPAVKFDTSAPDKSGKEILIGTTDRAESAAAAAEGIQYMDYLIRISGNKIVILGGSPLSAEAAADTFLSLIRDGSISSLDSDFEYTRNYHNLISDSIVFNIESFVPSWSGQLTVPAWMTDYEEKLYALTSPTGRLTADAHRGDTQNYPENSLEGILSAIMLGADVIEIDIRLTKDKVMVLMHDASLKRTTDWSVKMGKNGLPTSDKVEDWTYEQLRELRLLYNGKATDCMIPTMYEAALLFAGRAQIHFDCKVTDKIDKNTDVYLLAEATGSKESFIYYYGIATMQQWMNYDKEDKDFATFVGKMRKYISMPGHSLRRRNYDMIAKHGDKPEGWLAAWDEGYTMTFTNKIYDFSKYVAENCEPIKLPQ